MNIKKSKGVITQDNLIGVYENILASESRHNKKLFVKTAILPNKVDTSFHVLLNNKTVFVTSLLNEALDRYNEG